ncbi:hypothetical protein [Kocuria arenosa]|uniref:hypothetical protein n=1 Tax=Kocuria arenosa TaxID=3071446 RepID=UPI0034D4180C
MSTSTAVLKYAANGAVGGAATAAVLGLVMELTALLSGAHVVLPGLIDATGGTAKGRRRWSSPWGGWRQCQRR